MSISATINSQTRESYYSNTVAFCVDEKYLPYAAFVAIQIMQVDPYPIDICICVPDLDFVPENLKSLPIRFIELEIQGIEDFPTDHLSIAAYHRLFLPKLLRKDYEHIIYLDADVYIRKPFLKDIFTFITTCDSNFSVAAAPYMGEVELLAFPNMPTDKIKNYLLRYHKLNHLYRNSGVLVFNVNNFVNSKIQQHIFEVAISNIDKLESHDQSALNLALLTDIAHLPLQFNWQLNALSATVVEEIDPYLLHFVNVNKPWVTRIYYLNHYTSEYESFLDKYFSELTFQPLTNEEKRRCNPKYNGIKESLSVPWYKFKAQKKQNNLNNFYQKNKALILKTVEKVNQGTFSNQSS